MSTRQVSRILSYLRCFGLLTFFSLGALCCLETPVDAQTTYWVDSLEDDPTAKSNVVDGKVTLREAILAASTNRQFGDAPAGENYRTNKIRFSSQFSKTIGQSVIYLESPIVISNGWISIEGISPQKLAISGRGQHRLFRIRNGAKLQLYRMTLMDGVSELGNGGAVRIEFDGSLDSDPSTRLSLRNVEIKDCRARKGGAISIDGGRLSIDCSTIINNVANWGGGIHFQNTQTSAEINNSTMTGNHGVESGGAIFTETDYFWGMKIDHSTITGNFTGDVFSNIQTQPGAIGNLTDITTGIDCHNTIIAANYHFTPGDVEQIDMQANVSGEHNLIGLKIEPEYNASDGLMDDEDGNLVGDSQYPIAPRLHNIRYGFALTRHFPLRSNSPARNRAHENESGYSFDQREIRRPTSGFSHMGSVGR